MFRSKTFHICSVHDEGSDSFLPKLESNANFYKRFRRSLKKIILVAEYNPQSLRFFFSPSVIATERKKQVKANSWVIHPFSVFRLYYEMWMAVIFFLCLIVMPIQSTFETMIGKNIILNAMLRYACIVDIIINFRTGYCLRSREVEMRPTKIAKHYVCGIYFIMDVCSSLPQPTFARSTYREWTNVLSMLKIVRLFTFLQYMERSLYFFRMKHLYFKLVILTLLLAHYTACFIYFLPAFYKKLTNPSALSFWLKDTTPQVFVIEKINLVKFWEKYLKNWLDGSSYILGADIPVDYRDHWISYFFAIFQYMLGKLFIGFITIVLIETYRLRTCIEHKYYAMLSQVDAFMTAYKFPEELQNRVRQYYAYKYHRKYFNESRIERYISDKLRKEIKYQACQKLVQSVSFFESIPQEILENIVNYLKKEIYLAKDLIIKAGEVGDSMYFLSSGTVAVSSLAGKEICHLNDGDYFGEISLIFPGIKTTANIQALEICELYKLDRRSFKKCLENESELYKQIREEAKRRYFITKTFDKMGNNQEKLSNQILYL